MLGSLIPSSPFLVRRVLRAIDFSRAEFLVEYGPGIGNFTHEILRRMRPDAHLLAFETYPDFVRHVERALPDRRLEVVHASAEEVERVVRERGWGLADYVVSGIPFTLLPDDVRDVILRRTRSVLEPDGVMLIYQFSPVIRSHLERVFDQVRWEFEPRNILPALVFHCNGR